VVKRFEGIKPTLGLKTVLSAIAVLIILSATLIFSGQEVSNYLELVRSEESALAPTDPKHPRWNGMRGLASVEEHKHTHHRHETRSPDGMVMISKTEGVLRTAIGLLGQPPGLPSNSVRLQGQATAGRRLENVQFLWTLPPDVRLVSGTLSGSITTIEAGETKGFEVIVESLSSSPQRILFRAWFINQKGEAIGQTATFFTAPQASQNDQQPERLKAETPDEANQAPQAPRSPEEFRRRMIQ